MTYVVHAGTSPLTWTYQLTFGGALSLSLAPLGITFVIRLPFRLLPPHVYVFGRHHLSLLDSYADSSQRQLWQGRQPRCYLVSCTARTGSSHPASPCSSSSPPSACRTTRLRLWVNTPCSLCPFKFNGIGIGRITLNWAYLTSPILPVTGRASHNRFGPISRKLSLTTTHRTMHFSEQSLRAMGVRELGSRLITLLDAPLGRSKVIQTV